MTEDIPSDVVAIIADLLAEIKRLEKEINCLSLKLQYRSSEPKDINGPLWPEEIKKDSQ